MTEEQRVVEIDKKFDDYFKKVEEALQSKSIEIAISQIEEYPSKLLKTKGSKSISKLNNEHKENLTLLSEKCMEEYEEKYGKLREDERWFFMASTYFSVQEGHVTSLLVTEASPCSDDYDDSNNEPTTTKIHRAVREFYNEFGVTSLPTLGIHTREAFLEKYSVMIPHSLIKLKDKPCMLTFKTKLQYNFP